MRKLSRRLAALTPAFAAAIGGAVGGAAGASEPPRALALSVVEEEGSVAIELIAQSSISQQVDYEVELVGASRARHAGSTGVAAGERHVLSRMRTDAGDGWCATVDVTEESGASYTLKAGDCAA